MSSVSNKIYIDKLDDIVNKYSNNITKMKPVDVKSTTYIESSKRKKNKDPKSKFGDIVRIPEYKNIFAKGYLPNSSEEVFVTDLNGEEIAGIFYEKEFQKQIKKSLELKK